MEGFLSWEILSSKLIKLQDGTLVEVEVTGDEVQQISGGLAEKVVEPQ